MAMTLKELENISGVKSMQLQIRPIGIKEAIRFDMSKTVTENAKNNVREYYAYQINFNVYKDIGKRPLVAMFTVTILDEKKRRKDCVHLNCVNRVNMVATESFEHLFNDKEYNERIGENSSFLCYLDKFYVKPNYRRKGIGTYLLENLPDIIDLYFNCRVQAVTVYPAPMPLSGEVMSDSQKKRMFTKMKRCFEQAGYREMNESNFYVRIYEKEK